MIYALDTNTISYLLKDNDPVCSKYDNAIDKDDTFIIPIVVYYEVLRGLMANDAKKQMGLFEDLCSQMDILEFTLEDANAASRIYAYRKNNGLSVGDADILIAAQCIARGYALVTNNTKHFEGIEGLQLEDWTKA